MALKDLKSDLSYYGKNPGPYKPNTSRKDTKFEGADDVPFVVPKGYNDQGYATSFISRFAGDSFAIDDVTFSDRGSASRKAQLGSGTKFPIGPAGQIHTFDKVRTGFTNTLKYDQVYGVKHKNSGLADTYTAESPIDDMYNKFNLRDDATPQLGYINHPLILRGIQRRGSSDPQRWGLGNTIAGKLSSTFDIPRSGILTAVERGAVDVARIAKFIASPKGLAWGIKQFGLTLTGPNLEGADGTTRKPLGKNSPKLWMPTSTLLSPLVAQAGLHMRRTGLLPLDIPLILPHNYEDVLNFRTGASLINDNRLVKLKKELLPTPSPTGAIGALIADAADSLGLKMPIATLSGPTGPDSILGLGSTNINRFTNSSLKDQLSSDFKEHVGGLGGFTYEQYIKRYNHYTNPYVKTRGQSDSSFTIEDIDNSNDSKKKSHGGRQDIGFDPYGLQTHKALKSLASKKQPRPDGTRTKFDGGGMSERTTPEQGSDNPIKDYTRMAYGAAPKRTLSNKPVHFDFRTLGQSQEKMIGWDTDKKLDAIDETIDTSLIKFSIGGIKFKAYMDTLDDTFAPGWDGQQDQGRADARYLYQSFERTVNTSFYVPIYKEADRANIWTKLQSLARKTYPVYPGGETTSGFHGQTVNVTIGDLYRSKEMIITDLSYSWDTETPWEITNGNQAPFYTNVSIGFTVLGDRPESTSVIYQNI